MPVGKNHIAMASTSKKEQAKPPRQARHVGTPAEKALTHSTNYGNHKDKLRCLITFEKEPTAAQQAVHIVAQRTPTEEVFPLYVFLPKKTVLTQMFRFKLDK